MPASTHAWQAATEKMRMEENGEPPAPWFSRLSTSGLPLPMWTVTAMSSLLISSYSGKK